MALRVGRYVLHHEIASGGMARVYFGRMLGPAGFGRVVAIKRMFPQYASDPEFAAMFLDEAKLAARVQHPNVAATLDVVSTDEGELLQVMEYVPGEALSRLVKKLGGDPIPLDVIAAILCDALHGLHAAHEATDEGGEPIQLVHRDVSPQNLLVGSDGHTRVLDFGVAKAAGRLHTTKDGRVKGKIAYMSPEQLRGEAIDRRADIYSAGIVLWELLTGARLFMADSEGETAVNALERVIDAPSKHREGIAPALDALVLRALARDRTKRFTTARQMAIALEEQVQPASARRVGEWVEEVAGDILRTRNKTIADLEAIRTPEQEQERSSASVEVTPSRSTKKPSTRWLIAAGALLIGGTAIALSWKPPPKQTSAPPQTATTSVSVSVPVPAAESVKETVQVAVPPAVSASASASTSTKPKMTRSSTSTSTSTSTSASGSASPCPLRSYVDADGILRFTRDCK